MSQTGDTQRSGEQAGDGDGQPAGGDHLGRPRAHDWWKHRRRSLDSLGVGFALPALAIPLIPLLITVSITTTIFTFVGLAFGNRIGERYEHQAERAAGAMLVLLAVLFSIQHLMPHLH